MQQVEQLARQQWAGALHSTLNEHKIEHQIIGAVRSARLLVYSLRLLETTSLKKMVNPRVEEALALALGVDSVRVARYRGVVNLEVLLPSEYHHALTVDSLALKGNLWFTAGQTPLGQSVHIKLNGNRYAHALVAATTGAGKTYLLRLLLWEMIKHNSPEHLHIILVDGKGGNDYHDFVNVPHIVKQANNSEDALMAFAYVLAELERRKEKNYKRPEILLVVDEVRELLEATGGCDGGIAHAVQTLVSLGRGLGIHLVLATQHPRADVLGGKIAAANLPLRLVGRVMDASASTLATGQAGMGANRLYGEGDFLAVDGDTGQRLQVAALTRRAVGTLPRGSGPHVDFGHVDLARVVDLAPGRGSCPAPDRVAWALMNQLQRGLESPSANAVRKEFGGGTPQAMAVRDYAKELWQAFSDGGYVLRPYAQGAR